jgi:hypothetical protein
MQIPLLPRAVTVTGLVLAVAAVLVDPLSMPWLRELLGEHAATKLAAFGALIAALGRALVPPSPPPPPAE